jgi:ferredoxin
LAGGEWSLSEKPLGQWPDHYAEHLAQREAWLPADVFLIIDPLVSLSTAVASRSWVWSLVSAAAILLVCVLIPRGFCGYLCPLGTLIDLFDWAVSKRIKRFRVSGPGWWVHLKYYLLLGVMISALGGVLLSGFVAAIPVITRGFLLVGEPLQSGFLRGWHLVPSVHGGHFLSIGLFLLVLGLGLLKPRFWCRYLCPSGALFSLGNLFRVSERKVESTCIHCNKCVAACPFDAIKPDFTTRTLDCTLCQTCGGVCPTHAIKFVERWNALDLKEKDVPPTGESVFGRRGFLSWAVGGSAAMVGGGLALGATKRWGARLEDPEAWRPVRPPGSVPEEEFLQMCIRCGECFKVCPNNVLQPMGFAQGIEGLWTPEVKADWAGCDSSCNACGQVCPTGAIRALPIEEKKAARMGLALVNESTCLPFADREACQLCVDECRAAGYDAIEFTQVHTEVDAVGNPIPGSGHVAPVVLLEKCVGCGLCQTRCFGINVEEKGLLKASAIVIEAGEGREDRIMEGSYLKATPASAAQPTAPVTDPVELREDPFGL